MGIPFLQSSNRTRMLGLRTNPPGKYTHTSQCFCEFTLINRYSNAHSQISKNSYRNRMGKIVCHALHFHKIEINRPIERVIDEFGHAVGRLEFLVQLLYPSLHPFNNSSRFRCRILISLSAFSLALFFHEKKRTFLAFNPSKEVTYMSMVLKFIVETRHGMDSLALAWPGL